LLDGHRLVASAVVRGRAGAAYEPGGLALREGPLLEASVRAVGELPDVVLVNATGRDHPRGAGLALHLGSLLDVPSVGVTDAPLIADGELPDAQRGARSPLSVDGREVAAWVRTRSAARPVVVHPGWRTDLDTAVTVVLVSTGRARTPAPLRLARTLARAARAREDPRPDGRDG
jgi:deoxyribonuclease V